MTIAVTFIILITHSFAKSRKASNVVIPIAWSSFVVRVRSSH
jgi:hypothetical protein